MELHALNYRKTPRYFYSVQKGQAKARGIRFELTFDEWWTLWEPYWDKRGKGQDQYMMGRKGDKGPYKVDNVTIITGRENRKQAALRMPRGRTHTQYKEVPHANIIEDYHTGEYSWNKLAAKYGVSKRTIGRVLHGKHPNPY